MNARYIYMQMERLQALIMRKHKLRGVHPHPRSPAVRFPAVRETSDNVMLIARFEGHHFIEVLDHPRISMRQPEEFEARDETITVSEFPHKIKTVGAGVCLAVALADTRRLVGGVIHIRWPEDRINAFEYARWAMNSRREDAVLGLSGMKYQYDDAKGQQLVSEVAADASKYGRVVFNQLTHKGDIFVDFSARMIGAVYTRYKYCDPAGF
jgi:hypothetical protein